MPHNTYLSWDNLQFETIDVLRFPMAIMVMFIHMNPNVVNLIDADFDLFSELGLFNVTAILLSHVISAIVVPTFFLISGFLFFVNFKIWSWDGYIKKMKHRIKTLLIPYFLWNLIPFILTVICIYRIPDIIGHVNDVCGGVLIIS